MKLWAARIEDRSGAIIWANGYGDYIQAPDADAARAAADAAFLAPDPEPTCDSEARFLASIAAKRARAVADGYTITVRLKR